mgnify:FL=1|tara:strand:- start:1726 stop:1965 length:240 start_codon:yes stop_codon:yes gene_type:complete
MADKVMTENKLEIGGNEYLFDELQDDQKYAVVQIKNLNAKVTQAEFDINQLRAAIQHFHLTLSASLQKEGGKKKEKKND